MNLDSRLLCVCNVANAITAPGPVTGPALGEGDFYSQCQFTSPPTAVVAGADGIHAALVGEIPEGTVVAFRATLAPDDETRPWTQRLLDWLADFDARLVPSLGGAKVHEGFYKAVQALTPLIWPRIGTPLVKTSAPHLFLTGHSKGGAMAQIADEVWGKYCETVTFGAPRAGDADFAANFISPVRRLVRRYENENDIVPFLPGDHFLATILEHLNDGFATLDYVPAGELHYVSQGTVTAVPEPSLAGDVLRFKRLLKLNARLLARDLAAIRRAHSISFGSDYATALLPAPIRNAA